jgi:thermitase
VRSALLFRIMIVIGLLAALGVPGLQELNPIPAEAGPVASGMPVSDVWSGVLAAPGATVPAEDGTEPSEPLIVRFRPRAARAVQVNAHQEAGALRADALAVADTVRVEVPASQRDSALAAYNARADVLYAEPDYEVHALLAPNDPQFPNQWGMQKIGAQAAWDVTRGSPSVKVAIVDCGIFDEATGRLAPDGQPGHPDLRGRVAQNQDFTGSATGFDDYCNHGTHVAGIVGAAQNNAVGVTGLAPSVTLINAKVLGDSGSGSTSNILNGIVWAVQNGAKVINMSLGRDGACSQSERDTMNWAWSQGVVIVAAAGNSSLSSSGAPGNCDNVISVASTTSADARSSFSNYGTGVDVAAPGSNIISSIRTGDYASFNGTSMASPHVAALAGLIWSQNTGATAQSVVDRIRTTSDPIAGTGSSWAWGRINAAAALGGGSPPATSTPTSAPVATSTPTQAPIPTMTTCPAPRPPVQVTTTPVNATSTTVNVTAGAGVIRAISFRDLRNASITIGGRGEARAPFTFQPNAYSPVESFTATRTVPSQPWTVTLSVTDDCGVWTTFVGGGANSGPRGQIAGTVRSASTGQPIAGASVIARESGKSATTNGSGVYTLGDVNPGNVDVDVSANGYGSLTTQAAVSGGRPTTVNVSLVANPAIVQEISVALTWGASPDDLDVHMSGPTSGGSRFHLFWYNPDAAPQVSISGDDDNGGGPETITIHTNPSTGTWVPGEYRIWAHNYSGTPSFAASSAKVTVSRGGQQLGS